MKVEVIWESYGTMVGIDGVWRSLNEWCKELGLKWQTVRGRLRIGWTIEQALEIHKRPVRVLAEKPGGHLITDKERKQRGCTYCRDFEEVSMPGKNRCCPHKECPYRELDKHETYDEYMKATDLRGFVKALEEFGLSMYEEEEE